MDLTQHLRWRPLSATFDVAGWTVHVWQEPRLPDEDMLDPYLAQLVGGRLRLAVADPAETCPDLSAEDVKWSGQLAVGALAVHPRLTDGFHDATARLRDPVRRPRLAHPTTQLAAADIDAALARPRPSRRWGRCASFPGRSSQHRPTTEVDVDALLRALSDA